MLSKLGSRAAVAAATLALVVVSACSFKADVFLSKEFKPVVATVASPYTGTWDVDLAKEAPGAWKRRDNVKSLEVVGIEATATAIRGASAGKTVSGTLVLSRNGQNVRLGTYSHTLAASAPDSLNITMPESANALIKDAIDGDGKFRVTATANTTGAIDVDLKVVVHLAVEYEVKP